MLHVDRARQRAYALRWVGTEPGTAGYLASLSLNVARNWDEFQAAAARWAVPSENLLYADVDGNIGWVVGGLTPVRRGWNGLLPVPGHEGRFEWEGFLPARELPRSFNPADGVIATANHNILPPGYTKALGYDWSPPYRYQRIVEALALRPKWDVAGFEALQHDEVSLAAARVIDALRVAVAAMPVEGADRAFAVKMLTSWDGTLSGTSAPAALYELWLPHLQRAFVAVAYRPADRQHAPERLPFERMLDRLQKPSREDLAVLVGPALDAAFREARERMGPKPAEWAWQRLHRAEFVHPLATNDARRELFNLPPVAARRRRHDGEQHGLPCGAGARRVVPRGDGRRRLGSFDDDQRPGPVGTARQPPLRRPAAAVGDAASTTRCCSRARPSSSTPRPAWCCARRSGLGSARAPTRRPPEQQAAPRPAAPADAPPRLPPFAGTLVNYDRRGELTAACALAPRRRRDEARRARDPEHARLGVRARDRARVGQLAGDVRPGVGPGRLAARGRRAQRAVDVLADARRSAAAGRDVAAGRTRSTRTTTPRSRGHAGHPTGGGSRTS